MTDPILRPWTYVKGEPTLTQRGIGCGVNVVTGTRTLSLGSPDGSDAYGPYYTVTTTLLDQPGDPYTLREVLLNLFGLLVVSQDQKRGVSFLRVPYTPVT